MTETDKHFTNVRAAALPLATLLLAGTFPDAALSTETRCAYRFTRMAAAQTSRVIKEVAKCVRRNPSTYVTDCVPHVSSEDDLVAPEMILSWGLRRVEGHGDNKFPRKCAGVRTDFFEPACHDIEDTAKQLRRCLYNDYTLPFLEEALELIAELGDDGNCAWQALNRLRITWRDWILFAADEPDTRWQRKIERMGSVLFRACGPGAATDFFLEDTLARLRAHSADIRAVVPFDQRR